jgi:hypothetical protein
VKPSRNPAHDPDCCRYEHHRLGALATPWTSCPSILPGDQRLDSTEVIRRPRLRRDENVVAATLHAIREKALWVRPTESIRACADSDDDIFLECAQAARAAYLVTGNIKHFPASWLDTKIVTARSFLEVMSAETEEPPA